MSILEELFSKVDRRLTSGANKEYDPDNFWHKLKKFRRNRDTDTDKASWSTYGDGLRKHLDTFQPVFTEQELLTIMREHPDDFVAVEAMGPGQVIRDLYAENVDGEPIRIKKGIAITLSDERNTQVKNNDDALQTFHLVDGNILNDETVHRFHDVLGDDRISFFICRPVGGLKFTPIHEHQFSALFFYELINDVYEKMTDGGIQLLQFEASWEPLLREWVDVLNDASPNSAQLDRDPRKKEYVVLKILKSTESLAQLPGDRVRSLFRTISARR